MSAVRGKRRENVRGESRGGGGVGSGTGDASDEEAILRMGDTISLLYSETPAEGGIINLLLTK